MKRPVMKFYEGDDDGPPRVTGVPVFREGDYSPQGKYTAENVQEMADTYDPEFLEAPLTPDHEQTGPAWGWWERFYTVNTPDGLELYGDCKLLFVGEWMWKSGMYKRRSVEIYRDLELPNGEEGHYIKAVSILGAATPAVKGLKNMFAAGVDKAAKVFGMPLAVDFKGRHTVKAQAFSVEPHFEIPSGEPGPAQPASWGPPPPWLQSGQGIYYPYYQNQPEPASHERTDPEMDPTKEKAKQPENPGQFVQVNAQQFAEMQESMKQMAETVKEFKEQAENFKKQAEETRNQLAKESESRKAAEALAFQQEEDKRFDAAYAANKENVTPAVAKRLRALFHACPPDSDTERHVSFKDGANDRTLSMRGLVLECMSQGSKVIDLGQDPESDNSQAEEGATGKVPAYGTQEFFDQVDADAKALMAKTPDKYKSYTEAADEAHRSLMRRQPKERGASAKRRAIPKAE